MLLRNLALFVFSLTFIIDQLLPEITEASLYPVSAEPGSSTCDTTNVSYSISIKPILLQPCASYPVAMPVHRQPGDIHWIITMA